MNRMITLNIVSNVIFLCTAALLNVTFKYVLGITGAAWRACIYCCTDLNNTEASMVLKNLKNLKPEDICDAGDGMKS